MLLRAVTLFIAYRAYACRDSEQPGENMMSESAAPRRSVWDRLRLKRLVGLYGRQHSKETLPSCAMNDIATDVAAAIQ